MMQEESFKARLAKRNRGMGGRNRMGSVRSVGNLGFQNKLQLIDSSTGSQNQVTPTALEIKDINLNIQKESG